MSRLMDLLDDLRNMPGVAGAFLYCREGVLATTLDDPRQQDKIGRVYLNIMSGAFTLGHFVHEIYCDFNNAVVMVRPVGRGCILAAVCNAGVSTRLVDISLTMTAKSIEDEINSLDELPSPITAAHEVDSAPASPFQDQDVSKSDEDLNSPQDNEIANAASDVDESAGEQDSDEVLETESKG